jgi:RNA recognition motif-containing protein
MPVRLFVGNLSYDTTEAEIREHFSVVGSPSYVYLPTDRESGRLRGFAFIEFNDQAQADEAIRRLNNQPFKGRPLAVNEARARDSSPGMRKSPPAPPSRPRGAAEPEMIERPARGGSPSRQFGPDAAPRRNRKHVSRRSEPERGPKRPIPERLRGQFFGGDVDDADEDDVNDESFAGRMDDIQSEDNA